jgi:formamidopyrimidine-DNA glycosylase
MPELPEVETLRRGLSGALEGRRIVEAELLKPKIYEGLPGYSLADIVGATITAARRRAKYLILDLSNGLSLVIHLSLAGQIVVICPNGKKVTGGHPVPSYGSELPHRQTSVILRFDDGSILYLTDIRQFAHLWLAPTTEVMSIVPHERLGVEILSPEFSEAELRERLRQRPKAKLKPLLLDQSILAGLGNIYVDESLWEAGIHPLRTAGSLTDQETRRLYHAIRSVIDLALRRGVAQIVNGRAVVGATLPRIHGREASLCPRCGQPIEKTRVVGRGTYICRSCQKPP